MRLCKFKLFHSSGIRVIYSGAPNAKVGTMRRNILTFFWESSIRIAEVSENEACSLAAGIWSEVEHLPGVDKIPSAWFLRSVERLNQTGHQSRLGNTLEDFGLAFNVQLSYVDVGVATQHAVLSARDFVKGLNAEILKANRHAFLWA